MYLNGRILPLGRSRHSTSIPSSYPPIGKYQPNRARYWLLMAQVAYAIMTLKCRQTVGARRLTYRTMHLAVEVGAQVVQTVVLAVYL